MTRKDIIDVQPVEQSSQKAQARPSSNDASVQSKYYTYNSDQFASQPQTGTYYATPSNPQTSSANKGGVVSGAAKIVAGGAIALVGVPMLVLPGPGLLAIGGGIALMASGVKSISKR